MNIVGVDIGGTFTDLVGYQDGRMIAAKTSTTVADPTEGAAASLQIAGCDAAALDQFLHGSTIAINTVLERKGAATALITTPGFRDVYAIGRGNRPEGFNLEFRRPRPLIPRHLTIEVPERMNAAGEALTPLDADEIARAGEALAAQGVDAVAVCFLHSYANPEHERLAGEILRQSQPGMFVTCSHEILREFREYERTSTTALNAYVGPRVGGYLGRLQGFLGDAGFGGGVQIMRSNGGTMSIAQAKAQPVAMMESGPVAGMIGAGLLARHLGLDQCIGFDMGGTTAKTSLIVDGEAAVMDGYFIGGYASGQPMRLPVVDIIEVGAGGGSIAWCDDQGGLHVGPRSAGAEPGPACYGRGGEDPVMTDADLVLGRLSGARFLGGDMALDRSLAEAAIADKIARPLGLTVPDAARGIATIADAAMSLAVRAVSVERGCDPRDCALIAFGGAGPLHAISLAREIFIPKVVVPKLPGNFSALGMLLATWRQDFVRTFVHALADIDRDAATSAFEELAEVGRAGLADEGIDAADEILAYGADLRYRGQEHTIPVPVSSPEELAGGGSGTIRAAFDALHDRRYGHSARDEPIEMVNLRLSVTVSAADSPAAEWLAAPMAPEAALPDERRDVIFDDPEAPLAARIVWRPGLPAGYTVEGPAVIEEPNSTTLIHPGDVAEVTPEGHLMITLAPTT